MLKFQTQVTQGQVTRSRHVTTPQKKFECSSYYIECPIILNHSAIDLISVKVSIKCIYRNFNIGDPRSSQFCVLSIISQWEKSERHFERKTFETQHRFTGILDTLSQNIATSGVSSCRQGHFRSWRVTSTFSAISFDRDQVVPKTPYTCLGRRYGLTDNQHDFFRSCHDLDLRSFLMTLQG